MRQVNCYIPIKLCITGRLSDVQLEELGETLVRTLTARIAFAERTIASGRSVSEKWTIEKTQEPLDESRLQRDTYEVPSYRQGGQRQRVPVRRGAVLRRARPLRVKGPDTNANVYRFLTSLTRRLSHFHNVTLGRINGDLLEYGYQGYRLWPVSPLPEGLTFSAGLGEGVFFLQPVPHIATLRRGEAYAIQRVDSEGRLHATGLQVVAEGLGSIPAGVLVYSAHRAILSEVTITARRPRNTAALAQRVIQSLDIAFSRLNPGITVIDLLSILEPENLTNEETMAVLRELKRLGRLSEFLNYVTVPDLRRFLRQKDIEWAYIYENWEPSFNDSGLFFSGYVIGAAESVYDGLRLIGILIGGIFSEEMARERSKLWAAMKQFFAHPIINTISGLKLLQDKFAEALWNLEFFEAGRILGNVVVVILTLPEAVRALPKAARGLAKVAGAVARLTLRAIKELGISIRTLAQFVHQPVLRLALDNGMVLMKSGDEIIVLDRSGATVGRVVPKEFTPAEIAEWERLFKEPGVPPPSESPVTTIPAFLDLEDLVRQAIAGLRAQLGKTWLPSRHFGTRLHKVLEEIITASGQSPEGWRIFAERTIREIANLPNNIANLTLEEYLATRPHLREFLKIPEEMLKSKIGDLTPDLVIFEPGKAAVIWDLTAQSRLLHLAKTQLYAHILQDLTDLGFVRIGETYWKPLMIPVSPAAALPAAGAATKSESQKEP